MEKIDMKEEIGIRIVVKLDQKWTKNRSKNSVQSHRGVIIFIVW